MALTPSRRSLTLGLRVFIALTILGFVLIFYLTGTRETLQALSRFRFLYFLIAAGLIAVDFAAGAFRIFIFARTMMHRPDREIFWACFRANLANIFMAAATPFQTGGGVAQIYILNRSGLPVSAGVSVSVINFVATLIFLLIAGLLALRWIHLRFSGFGSQLILSVSSGIFYLVLAFFLFFLFRPRSVFCFVDAILAKIERRRKKTGRITKIRHTLSDFTDQYQSHITRFWKEKKTLLVHNVWLTGVLYFNKCLMAYVLLKGMGLSADFWQVISVQFLLIFIIYFCPTPGASFLAETSAAALMSLLIPKAMVSVFSVLWRFFTTYFGVILGGIILMSALKPSSSSAPSPAKPMDGPANLSS